MGANWQDFEVDGGKIAIIYLGSELQGRILATELNLINKFDLEIGR